MKTYFTSFGLLTAIIIGASILFTSCDKDDHVVRFTGRIVHTQTSYPFPGCLVTIENHDGKTFCQNTTDEKGRFILSIRASDGWCTRIQVYYLTEYLKEVRLYGWGRDEVDLGTINVRDPSLPSVTTMVATNITCTEAVCGGKISSTDYVSKLPVTDRGVCWSKSELPTLEDEHTNNGEGAGEYQSKLTNLQSNTTYYVRAYAMNAWGIAYGQQIQFTTQDGRPKVLTTTPTLNRTTIITGGQVTSDNGFEITARGICYGTLPNPDLSNLYIHTNNGTGVGSFTSSFDFPVGNGTIYIRAYATNVHGTEYGSQEFINIDYLQLPSFAYNNHRYRVAPTASTAMTLVNAKDYCNNLEQLYGYSNWRLPTDDELLYMYEQRNTIGGFKNSIYWSSYARWGYYYYVNFYDGAEGSCGSPSDTHYLYNVRPIRQED